ncbi:MAG: TonB-dependent receptor [Gammaproteobacteria bacterium]|nr:TonB-dependent receptor [Gammaproteobacteria bacterium]
MTGSRLLRSRDLVEVSPVQTVDFEEIRLSGNVTLEDTLNAFPQLNPDNTGTVNQSGGAGVLSADLRGLGAVRTLVLVDGRRYIPADVTGLVDLSTIPDGLVERVEIITGGASAVYGSDAIAGAVNFILKDDFEGAEFRAQYGETSRGDGQNRKLDLLLGVNTDDGRGNATVHASYTNRDPVFMGDRAFSRQPLLENAQGRLVNFGSGNIPGGLIGISAANAPLIQGVDLTNANGACPGAIQGVRFGANGQPFPFCRPTEQYNYAAVNFLLRPFERWQVSTTGHYDFTERVQGYAQFFYTKKENEFQQAPEAVSPTSSGQETGTVLITNADTNPLYPQALRDFFAANRSFFDSNNDGIFVVRSTSRRFEEFGPRNTSITADSFNLTSGLRGDLNFGEQNWKWDAFFQFSRSDVEFIQTGLLSRSRTTLGLDSILVGGQPACRTNLLGCVPVNIFGTNTLTPQMADFLSVQTGRTEEFLRKMSGASLAGDLFDLPAGPVAAAVGLEWRREEFESVPDEISSSGDLTSQAIAPRYNQGDFEIFELFAEFRVPLLVDLPAIKGLAIEGAVRQSDYSTIDTVVTWKGLLDWEITDWVRVRGGLSRAIRAPNLNELFAQPGAGFTGGVDPCWITSTPTAAEQQLCIQQGVPASTLPTFVPGASQGWNALSGGNPNLQEEEADTFTAGVVFTSDILGGHLRVARLLPGGGRGRDHTGQLTGPGELVLQPAGQQQYGLSLDPAPIHRPDRSGECTFA